MKLLPLAVEECVKQLFANYRNLNNYPSPKVHSFTGNGARAGSSRRADEVRGFSETGYSYCGTRYYDSGLSGLFLSVDPMSDKYPSISPYAYCVWNPLKLVDLDGNVPIHPIVLVLKGFARGVEFLSRNSNVKTIAFSVNHPYEAFRTGLPVDGGRINISSYSHNFSVNMCKVANLSMDGKGSFRNAIRHTLWQAMLTSEFGASQAERIGDNHESGPKSYLSQRTFNKMEDADKVADLLNNEIGRQIGGQNKDANNIKMAGIVATELYNNGLWTVSENKEGSYSIHRTKISKEQYSKIMDKIIRLNSYGLSE